MAHPEQSGHIRVQKIIKVVGVIVTPTALIAIVADLMGMPRKEAATLSLIVLAVTAILLFKEAINTKLKSAGMALFMLALLAVFVISNQHLIYKDTGLIRFFKNSDEARGEMISTIGSSRRELWMFATNFYITFKNQKSLILEKMSKGVNVFVLVYDPTSAGFDKLAEDFSQAPKDLRAECDISLAHALDIQAKAAANGSPGRLEIRFYSTTPRLRAYLADPLDDTAVSLLIPHMNDVDSPQLPVYLFSNTSHGVVRSYYDGLKHLWQRSRSFDQFSAEQRAYIASLPKV